MKKEIIPFVPLQDHQIVYFRRSLKESNEWNAVCLILGNLEQWLHNTGLRHIRPENLTQKISVTTCLSNEYFKELTRQKFKSGSKMIKFQT